MSQTQPAVVTFVTMMGMVMQMCKGTPDVPCCPPTQPLLL